mmetsp:Transcript_85851/g.255980  ORF Transcript_85851/g.255980 Transcript_85851/m.255980 type:complete len:529 (+) Transcript_85851:65-1651(+)
MALHSFEWLPLREHAGEMAPCARWGHTSVLVDDSVVLLGGTDTFEGALAEVFRYSEEAGWRALETTGCPRLAAHTANLIGRHIYCFGGDGQGGDQGAWMFGVGQQDNGTATWALNVDTLAWSAPSVGGKPPKWRRTAASSTVESRAYIIGGWGVGGPLNDVHVLNAGGEQCAWEEVRFSAHEQTLPQRGSHSATTMGAVGQQRILVYGGFNGQQLGDLWVLDVARGHPSWQRPQTKGASPPGGRSGHSATASGNQLVLLGGERELQRTFFHDVYVLDTDAMVWSAAQISGTAPQGRGWHSSTLLPGSRVMVFGGGKYTEFFGDTFVLDLAAGGSAPVPPDDLAADLGALLAREDLADVRFALEGRQVFVHAHRVVLCARSPVFDTMLAERGRWAEGSQTAIPIDNISAESFHAFLQYLYTGTCGFGRSGGATPGAGNITTAAAVDAEGVSAVADRDVRCALDILPLSSLHMLPRLQAQCETVLGRALKQRVACLAAGSPALEELLRLSRLHDLNSLHRLAQEPLQQQV